MGNTTRKNSAQPRSLKFGVRHCGCMSYCRCDICSGPVAVQTPHPRRGLEGAHASQPDATVERPCKPGRQTRPVGLAACVPIPSTSPPIPPLRLFVSRPPPLRRAVAQLFLFVTFCCILLHRSSRWAHKKSADRIDRGSTNVTSGSACLNRPDGAARQPITDQAERDPSGCRFLECYILLHSVASGHSPMEVTCN